MPYDPLIIDDKSFNILFKNLVREFYVYQFKEKGKDFVSKGKNGNDNAVISDQTFNPSQKRIYSALCKKAGVTWKVQKNEYSGKKFSCVTIDSREMIENPFFELYEYRSERSNINGGFLYFLFSLLINLNRETFEFAGSDFTDAGLESIWRLFAEEIYDENNNNPTDRFYEIFEYFEEERLKNGSLQFSDLTDPQARFFISHLMPKLLIPETIYNLSDEQRLMVYNLLRACVGLKWESLNGYKRIITEAKKSFSKQHLTALMCFETGDIFGWDEYMHAAELLGLVKYENSLVFLSENSLKNLLNNIDLDRFCSMISFFSQISPLGKFGDVILKRLHHHSKSIIKYKHHYIQKALNDYNLIDLLYVINHNKSSETKYWIFVEYRNASSSDMQYQKMICYPVEIRESVINGRQHLICYFPDKKSISALRVDFIDSIKIGTLKITPADFESDIEKAKVLIDHTWGTAFPGFNAGNLNEIEQNLKKVEIIIRYNDEEEYIYNRIKREARGHIYELKNEKPSNWNYAKVYGLFNSEKEILFWAQSFINRIVSVKVNGKEYTEFFENVGRMQQIIDFYQLTQSINLKDETDSTISNSNDEKHIFKDDGLNFDKVTIAPHDMIFNELFGKEFEHLVNIFDESLSSNRDGENHSIQISHLVDQYVNSFNEYFEAVKSRTKGKKLSEIESARERREEQAKYIFDKFIGDNEFTFKYRETSGQDSKSLFDLIPLTYAEIQWVNNVLSDPLSACFFSKEETEILKERFPDQRLFCINDVVLYDRFTDLDGFYENSDIFDKFQAIFNAVLTGNKITIGYKNQYNTAHVSPVCFEFTKRENRFRFYGQDEKGFINLYNIEKIQFVENTSEPIEEGVSKKFSDYIKNGKRSITLLFSDTKNTSERILTEFSPWEKTCVRQYELYRMTLTYDLGEWREIVIRLLSYGDNVVIVDDSGPVREEIKKRVSQQMDIINHLSFDKRKNDNDMDI